MKSVNRQYGKPRKQIKYYIHTYYLILEHFYVYPVPQNWILNKCYKIILLKSQVANMHAIKI